MRPSDQKERLFGYQEQVWVWTGFGCSHAYLEGMKSQSFWDAESEKIDAIDEALLARR